MKKSRAKRAKITAIDLFCGVGGLTHGLINGGIDVKAGIDIDVTCRFPYEANNDAQFIEQDVSSVSAAQLKILFGRSGLKLLAGCAPCQPFSTYSQSGRNQDYHGQWPLVMQFGRLIKECRPELVTMENVPQLVTHSVFNEFLGILTGYKVWWSVIECSSIGIPQTRKRLVLMASLLGERGLNLNVKKDDIVTVRETIAHLPSIAAGQRSSQDPLHVAPSLSPINLERIKASRPGGTWRDWPKELQAACHQRSSGITYPSVYGRMEWDKCAPTITTQCFGYGNGRFGHPEQDRAISLREAAMIQTFPRDYIFAAQNQKIRFNKLGRLIGNAVPVKLGETIAKALMQHIVMET